MRGHVFVSYARRDQDFVDRLVDTLERRGETVWIDREDIPASLKWMDRIRSAIVDARACLFVISRHAVDSEVWKARWQASLHRRGELDDLGARVPRSCSVFRRTGKRGDLRSGFAGAAGPALSKAARRWSRLGDETTGIHLPGTSSLLCTSEDPETAG